MKLFGKLTRETFEWHPDQLLCRRFNVPDPHPGYVQHSVLMLLANAFGIKTDLVLYWLTFCGTIIRLKFSNFNFFSYSCFRRYIFQKLLQLIKSKAFSDVHLFIQKIALKCWSIMDIPLWYTNFGWSLYFFAMSNLTLYMILLNKQMF